ncbi:tetratricopeptide repeat protein [Microvirga tunisiensis]|uniref:tetratricopeptide repeat protein n=1 Tax=Microvirga tunisiensis TaxID=2108360 RepID=UPI00128E00CC|nr:tetratricopeptide repeat protein [Microvirga tunisiensis]MPR11345.1 tetratricopeptide repeat protein [Microvirga tunisiensis]
MLGRSDGTVGASPQAQSSPSAADVRAQLDRLLASPDLDAPARARKFLRYVVEETLAGRAERIKAYAIGTEVFERSSDFDAQNDPAVRIEAGRLRRALERYYLSDGLSDPVVITIPKGAYVPHFAWHTPQATEPHPAPTAVSPRSPVDSPPRHWIPWRVAIPVVVALLAFIGGLILSGLWRDGASRTPEASVPLPPGGPTLVVMPFTALGEPSAGRTYADGLTEELLSQFARFKEITLLGRETSRSIPPGADAAHIRRDLGVRYVLEGSVQAAEHRLRITGRLLDAQTGAVLWSQTYDEDLQVRDLFTIQDDVARKVATAVAQPYGIIQRADQVRARAPDDIEAYGCTLRFYDYRAALSEESHAAIRTCLEQAVALHPDYATAWAMLSVLYLDEDRFGFNPRAGSSTPIQRSLEAARRAIRLDPENVRSLQALMMALFFAQQPAEALEVGERAVALNPNDTELLGEFGTRLGQAGAWQRGAELLEQALARNPGHSGYYSGTLAVYAYMQHDYARAESLIRQAALEKFPLYHFVAAVIYAQLGKAPEAAEARDAFLRMRPTIFERWDDEMAKRNYRPEDAAHFAEGARKAGFPVPARTAAETALQAASHQR